MTKSKNSDNFLLYFMEKVFVKGAILKRLIFILKWSQISTGNIGDVASLLHAEKGSRYKN